MTNVRFSVSQGRNKPKLYYTSEIKVNAKLWNKKEQGISSRITFDTQKRIEINTAIFERKNLILKAYSNLKDPTSKSLTAEINRLLANEIPEADTIQNLFKIFLSRKKYSQSRIYQFRALCNLLSEFEIQNNIKIDIHQSDSDFLFTFEKFLNDGKKGENHRSSILRKLRTFFLWLEANDYTTNNPFRKYKPVAELYGTPYYLTIEERNKIYLTDLSDKPTPERQRDIFVFHCCTGCRVGDLIKLTRKNVIDGAVEYVANKTFDEHPQTIRVPLNKIAADILKKYEGLDDDKLLPFISPQKYNEAIKEIFTIAGITRKVTVINSLTRKAEQRPLNEIASSHIARRTFIGNLYKQVKDPNLIGSLSGHAEGSKAFARYREIDEDIKKDLVKLIE
jgi:integrase